jgi:hypothetical protein
MVPGSSERSEAKQLKDLQHRDPHADLGEMNPRHGSIPRTQRRKRAGKRRSSWAGLVETEKRIPYSLLGCDRCDSRSLETQLTKPQRPYTGAGVERITRTTCSGHSGCPRATQLSLPTVNKEKDEVK